MNLFQEAASQACLPLTQLDGCNPRCSYQGCELGLFADKNVAVFRKCLSAIFFLAFLSIFEKLGEFLPNLHVVPHSEISSLKMITCER